jgi:branched-subunit amino acid aminotransferase/4-amino-4-deoxychorismate lyase
MVEEHAARIYKSCRNDYIKPEISREQTVEITKRLVRENADIYPGCELGIIYYITAGENLVYAGSAGRSANAGSTYIQHVFPLPFYLWKNLYAEGARLVTPATLHIPPQCIPAKGKHRNRLHMWIGDKQAQAADPGAIGLFLDMSGCITETGGANILVYKDGKVISPRSRNILWGISLQVTIDILSEMGIPFIEDDLLIFDVANADEAWLTTSPYCIAPVKSINGIEVGEGKRDMWRELLDRWSRRTGKDLYNEIACSEKF